MIGEDFGLTAVVSVTCFKAMSAQKPPTSLVSRQWSCSEMSSGLEQLLSDANAPLPESLEALQAWLAHVDSVLRQTGRVS